VIGFWKVMIDYGISFGLAALRKKPIATGWLCIDNGAHLSANVDRLIS